MSARPQTAPSGSRPADESQNPASSSIAGAFEDAAGDGGDGFNPKEFPSMVGLVEDAFADVAGDAGPSKQKRHMADLSTDNAKLEKLLHELCDEVEELECPEIAKKRRDEQGDHWVTKLSPRHGPSKNKSGERAPCTKFQKFEECVFPDEDNHAAISRHSAAIKTAQNFLEAHQEVQEQEEFKLSHGDDQIDTDFVPPSDDKKEKNALKGRTSVFTVNRDPIDLRPVPELEKDGATVTTACVPGTNGIPEQASVAVLRERHLQTLQQRNQQLRELLKCKLNRPNNWGHEEEMMTKTVQHAHLHDKVRFLEVQHLQARKRQLNLESKFATELEVLKTETAVKRDQIADRKMAKADLEKIISQKRKELHTRKLVTDKMSSQLALNRDAIELIRATTAQEIVVGDLAAGRKMVNKLRTMAVRLLNNNLQLEAHLLTETRLKCQHQLACKDIEKACQRRHYLDFNGVQPTADFTALVPKEPSIMTEAAGAGKNSAPLPPDTPEVRRKKLESMIEGDYERMNKLFANPNADKNSSVQTSELLEGHFVDPYAAVTQTDPNADQIAIDFLTFLRSSEGFNPNDFLRDLSQEQQDRCLKLLCAEISAVDARLVSVDNVLEHLDQLRASRSLPRAATTLYESADELFGCDHCSYWITCSGGQNVQASNTTPEGKYVPGTNIPSIPHVRCSGTMGQGMTFKKPQVLAWCSSFGHKAHPIILPTETIDSGEYDTDDLTVIGRIAIGYSKDQFVCGTGRIFAEQGTTIGKTEEDQRTSASMRQATYSDFGNLAESAEPLGNNRSSVNFGGDIIGDLVDNESVGDENDKEVSKKRKSWSKRAMSRTDMQATVSDDDKGGVERYGHWCVVPVKRNDILIGVMYIEKEDASCAPDGANLRRRTTSEDGSEESSEGADFSDGLCCWANNHTDRLLFQILGYAMVEMVARFDVSREIAGNSERNKHLLSIATEFHRYCRGFTSFLMLLRWSMRLLFLAEDVQIFIAHGDGLARLQTAGIDAVHQPGEHNKPRKSGSESKNPDEEEQEGGDGSPSYADASEGQVIGQMEFPTSGTVRTHFPADAGLAGCAFRYKRGIHCHFHPSKSSPGGFEPFSSAGYAEQYDDQVDLPLRRSAMDSEWGGYIHTWPHLRGRQVTAVLQWTSPYSKLAGCGDNGSFSESRQSHIAILSTFNGMLQVFLDRFMQSGAWTKSAPAHKHVQRGRMSGLDEAQMTKTFTRSLNSSGTHSQGLPSPTAAKQGEGIKFADSGDQP